MSPAQLGMTHAVVITDDNVETPHAISVAESLSDADVAVDLMVVDAGETSKSVQTAERLWQQLLEANTDRKSVVVAVGGGVIGDLAGFVAATYARGLAFVQVPTTLLAQVDSSVGGKVAINLPDGQEHGRRFLATAAVIIDTRVLATLAATRISRRGWGEVVKYGVIQDADFFAYLEQHVDQILARDDDVLRHVVAAVASSRPTSCGTTNGNRAVAGPSSITVTRSATPWRLPPAINICCTAKPWPSACCALRDWRNHSTWSMRNSPIASVVC